jgi:septum formation protein
MAQKIILASGSEGRQQQLRAAGLTFDVKKPKTDEDAIALKHAGEPLRDVAEHLAIAKGLEVSTANPNAVVIAGDQICALGDEVLHKPNTNQNAVMQLEHLQGKTHHLHTSACICVGGEVVWQFATTTALHMRDLSFEEIEAYVAADDVRFCCGSYKIEGAGMRLFQRIDGDQFAIQGLPILQVVNALYENGFISLKKQD